MVGFRPPPGDSSASGGGETACDRLGVLNGSPDVPVPGPTTEFFAYQTLLVSVIVTVTGVMSVPSVTW